ncbi:unnamed protein product [Symbiodinium natans]|uniref:Ubiquitin-like domain-containing protein n=1 Tax=Symbiodinium natans TaxID=878477 RepID=A0A812MW00_9DINO|nr:unnamed protein product [Symbiodinium natans]
MAEVALSLKDAERWLQHLLQPQRSQGCLEQRKQVEAARALVLDYADRIRQAEAEEELNVNFIMLSGAALGELRLTRPTMVPEVKRQLQSLVGEQGWPSKLVLEGTILDNSQTVGSAGITFDTTIQVVVQPAAYLVESAGVEKVNGYYFKSPRRMNEAVMFTNTRGIMLFRYIMRRGTPYWYFSDAGDLTTKHGDYYRIRSTDRLPPAEGWITDDCPRGEDTACPTLRLLLEPEVLLEDCSPSGSDDGSSDV